MLANAGDLEWFRAYEQRLGEDGAKLVLLTAKEQQHRVRLCKRSGSEFFSTYGRKYGSPDELVIQHYRREQQSLLDRVAGTPMLTLVLDSSDHRITDRALRFWVA